MADDFISKQVAFWEDDLAFWRRMLELYQGFAKAEGKNVLENTTRHIAQAERNISLARRFLAKYYRKDLGAGLPQTSAEE